jgi:tetratricopeptide (TPR) repeat protein
MFDYELINFRDPLFGIIILFLALFLVSFLTYTIGLYNERKARKEYRKLLKRFELGTLKEDDYIHLYSTYNLPFDSILLLASSFLIKGQHNKAISVYLALLEHVKDQVKKEELLELLGNVYFKSGMLQRSKEIYLKILKFSPRNKIALNALLLIFQRLKEYDNAQDVINSLNELDEDIILEEIYLNILQIIDDPILSFDKKSIQLFNNAIINKKIQKIVISYLLQFNKNLFWSNIAEFNTYNIIDLLWYLDFDDINWSVVAQNELLKEIFSAKGYIDDCKSSDTFELHILISTKNSSVKTDLDLNFEFMCTKCKKIHPMYEDRCLHCNSLMSHKVQSKLGKPSIDLSSLV